MKQGSNDQRLGGVRFDATVVGRGPVAFSECLGQCASTQKNSAQWNVPGRYGPYGELFFFLLEKEPMVLRELVRVGPASQLKQSKHVPWLLMMAEKNSWRSGSGSSVSSSSSSENNVGNGALFVGLYGSGDKISLFLQEHSIGNAMPRVFRS